MTPLKNWWCHQNIDGILSIFTLVCEYKRNCGNSKVLMSYNISYFDCREEFKL